MDWIYCAAVQVCSQVPIPSELANEKLEFHPVVDQLALHEAAFSFSDN